MFLLSFIEVLFSFKDSSCNDGFSMGCAKVVTVSSMLDSVKLSNLCSSVDSSSLSFLLLGFSIYAVGGTFDVLLLLFMARVDAVVLIGKSLVVS